MRTTFRITTPHTPGLDYHAWWFPNGWRDIGPTDQRDGNGHAQGERKGIYPEWFVLACNNTECAGRAAVPVSLITDHADNLDPAVEAQP